MALEPEAKFLKETWDIGKELLGEIWTDVKAMAKPLVREGAKDLFNAIVPAFPESVHGVDEPGTPLVPTQTMVTREIDSVQAPSAYEQFKAQIASQEIAAPEQERGITRD